MWIVARCEWIIYNQCSDVCLYSVGCLGHQNWDQVEAGLALVHIRVKQSCYRDRLPLHPFAHTRLLGNGLWRGNIPVPFCKTLAKPEGSLRYVWDIQGMLTVSPLLTAVSSPLAAVISQRPSSLSVFLTKYNRWGKSWNSHLEVKHIYSTFHGHHPHKCLAMSCQWVLPSSETKTAIIYFLSSEVVLDHVFIYLLKSATMKVQQTDRELRESLYTITFFSLGSLVIFQ